MKNIISNIRNLLNAFKRRGLLGRKEQVKFFIHNYLGVAWTEADVDQNQTKQLYQTVCERYTQIRVHLIRASNRIGEYIPRYLIAVEDAKRNAENGILDVFFLGDYVNHNSRLTTIMGRNIQIIDQKNGNIWGYILAHFPKVEFRQYFGDYLLRDNERLLDPQNTAQYLSLTPEEMEEAKRKKELMDLREPFVCVSNRDDAYLATTVPDEDWSYHDYRDSDINNFAPSADYLAEKGITSVRMGRYVQERVKFGNCIDYASKYYDELMDIALMQGCKFYVGDANGLCIVPMALNTPYALKNIVPIFMDGWGSHPQNVQSLYIFKKYYSKVNKRFLSINEMIEVDNIVAACGREIDKKYAELGIELIENSAEEILDLVMEMNARLDGEWIDTEEDLEMQKKYHSIFEQWRQQVHYSESAVLRAKLGALFLRKNSYLLD